MINPLKVATSGYLKQTTKAVLVIAVAGYLNFGGTPPTPPEPHGGGGHAERHYDKDKEQREKNEIEDSEIIAIVELTLKHFII